MAKSGVSESVCEPISVMFADLPDKVRAPKAGVLQLYITEHV